MQSGDSSLHADPVYLPFLILPFSFWVYKPFLPVHLCTACGHMPTFINSFHRAHYLHYSFSCTTPAYLISLLLHPPCPIPSAAPPLLRRELPSSLLHAALQSNPTHSPTTSLFLIVCHPGVTVKPSGTTNL